jgi:predicted GNAT family acetyltransferase
VLKLAGARLLDNRDAHWVRTVLDEDPVSACMVAARVETAGTDPWRLGGELWGFGQRLDGLCFVGANLVPLRGDRAAVRAFADRALRRARTCSSLVGPAGPVLALWQELMGDWGPSREVRGDQPLLAMTGPPHITPDPLVRPVRLGELDRYLPAAIAMFTEEVGIDPTRGDGGAGYRARVAELVAAGRAFARFEGGVVVFKAEIGALSRRVGQLQGVWVHPEWRGRGLGSAGTAAVVQRLVGTLGRVASLYVNSYNHPARAAYRRLGFRQVGTFATVLF